MSTTSPAPGSGTASDPGSGNTPSTHAVWPGHAYPLGATYDGSGTNFALFSEVAERVELCLFEIGRAHV